MDESVNDYSNELTAGVPRTPPLRPLHRHKRTASNDSSEDLEYLRTPSTVVSTAANSIDSFNGSNNAVHTSSISPSLPKKLLSSPKHAPAQPKTKPLQLFPPVAVEYHYTSPGEERKLRSSQRRSQLSRKVEANTATSIPGACAVDMTGSCVPVMGHSTTSLQQTMLREKDKEMSSSGLTGIQEYRDPLQRNFPTKSELSYNQESVSSILNLPSLAEPQFTGVGQDNLQMMHSSMSSIGTSHSIALQSSGKQSSVRNLQSLHSSNSNIRTNSIYSSSTQNLHNSHSSFLSNRTSSLQRSVQNGQSTLPTSTLQPKPPARSMDTSDTSESSTRRSQLNNNNNDNHDSCQDHSDSQSNEFTTNSINPQGNKRKKSIFTIVFLLLVFVSAVVAVPCILLITKRNNKNYQNQPNTDGNTDNQTPGTNNTTTVPEGVCILGGTQFDPTTFDDSIMDRYQQLQQILVVESPLLYDMIDNDDPFKCTSIQKGLYWLATHQDNINDNADQIITILVLAILHAHFWGNLDAARRSIDDDLDWFSSSNDTAFPVCSWFGITCDDNSDSTEMMIIALQLSGQRIHSNIPTELGLLTTLELLDLSDNSLYGSIPSTSLNGLSNLRYLDLSENGLTGTIPFDEFQNLTRLEVLILDRNQFDGGLSSGISALSSLAFMDLTNNDISGSIPSEIGSLPLVYFRVSNNRMDGKIPSEIGSLIDLVLMDLSINRLTGTIPIEVFEMSNLEHLKVNTNGLSGSIPTQLDQLGKLKSMNLAENIKLGGMLPTELGLLSNLDSLVLSETNIQGTLPTELGKCTNLEILAVSGSPAVTGRIPSELGYLRNLEWLELSDCSLEGQIPPEVLNLENLQVLNLRFNGLGGPLPLNVSDLSKLSCLDLAENDFVGGLPSGVCNLPYLEHDIIVDCEGRFALNDGCACCTCWDTQSSNVDKSRPCTLVPKFVPVPNAFHYLLVSLPN